MRSGTSKHNSPNNHNPRNIISNKLHLIFYNIDDSIKYLLTFVAFLLLLIAIVSQLQSHRYPMALFNLAALLTWIITYLYLKYKGYINPLRSYKSLLLTMGIFSIIGTVIWGPMYQTLTVLFITVVILLTNNSRSLIIYLYGSLYIIAFISKTLILLLRGTITFDILLDNTLVIILLIVIIQQLGKLSYLREKAEQITNNFSKFSYLSILSKNKNNPKATNIVFPPLLEHLIKNIITENKDIATTKCTNLWRMLALILPLSKAQASLQIVHINRIIEFIKTKINRRVKFTMKVTTSTKFSNTLENLSIEKINAFFLAFFEATINALKYGNAVSIIFKISENRMTAMVINTISLDKSLALIQKDQVKNTVKNIQLLYETILRQPNTLKISYKQILNKIVVTIIAS